MILKASSNLDDSVKYSKQIQNGEFFFLFEPRMQGLLVDQQENPVNGYLKFSVVRTGTWRVWSGYCITKNILVQTPVWRYIRRHIWRQGRPCSIIAQDPKSHHGNAYPQLWIQVVENFQMPSTVCTTYTGVACRLSFHNSVAKEKKLKTQRCLKHLS